MTEEFLPPQLKRFTRGEPGRDTTQLSVITWARELAVRSLVLDKPVLIPIVGEIEEVSAYAAFLLRNFEEAKLDGNPRFEGRRDIREKCLKYLLELKAALEKEGIKP